MFEPEMYRQIRDAVTAAMDARANAVLATGPQLCDAARLLHLAQTALDGVQADLLSRIDDTRAFEDEGASTVATWMSRELRIPIGRARSHVKAGHTLQALPDAAEAMGRGEIRLAHVHELTAGITKLGKQVMIDAQHELLPLAKSADPAEVRIAVNHLIDTLTPDGLDDAYADGMDKRDVKLAKCGDGYHVSGFLDILTGAKVHAFLKAASAGDGDGDDRSPSERRVDALGRMVDDAADRESTGGGRNGIKPQLHVIANLETLLGVPGAEAARLSGFGPIGRDLLGYLTCTGETTAVLTDGHTHGPTAQANVLNVGRTSRLANGKQRAAVIARQDGHCASPACSNTALEIHHVAWWTRDHGRTDLANLVGLCSKCHHLVHRQKLTVTPDGHGGFTLRRSTGRRIDDHVRRSRERIRGITRRLLRETRPGQPPTEMRPPRPTRPSQQPPRSAGERYLARIAEHHRNPMRR